MARKRTNKKISKRVLFVKTIEIMKPIMNLSDWKLIVTFSHSKRMSVTAYCSASPEYKFARIKMNHADLKDLSYNEIVATAIHEMIHCVLWNLGEWAATLSKKDARLKEITRQHEEGAVTSFEKILIPLVTERINASLREQGYADIDLTFTDFAVSHDRGK